MGDLAYCGNDCGSLDSHGWNLLQRIFTEYPELKKDKIWLVDTK